VSLKSKLGRLQSAGPGTRTVEPVDDAVSEEEYASRSLAAELLSDLRPAARASEASRAIPGESRETPHGPVHFVERYCEPHHLHGTLPIARALDASAENLAKLALDPALLGLDVRRMLLVDTETTGLSGGTGTIPFLVGMAWFEDESLRVEQLFLPRLGEEAPMLRRLAERLAASSMLVSYNGKSFDWPLLRTRFVMNRVPVPPLPPHLDLLHCARRVWKRRLEAVRLVHLEEQVLGFHREDDLAGADIPAAYLGWLRGGESGPIAQILEHNASDLIALAAVLSALHDRFAAVRVEDDPRDQLSLAHVALRARDLARAHAFACAAAEGGGTPELTAQAFALLAKLARLRGDDAAAAEALCSAIAAVQTSGLGPTIAALHLTLSKLYEHRLRDLGRALEHAHAAAAAEEPEASARRIARLVRRA
jgi:uncharacterized protein YprB with RNaseH-like and TPR domain